MSSSASANSLDSGAAPDQPEAGLTPGELLDIGASRQNHYAVQVAPNGAADFVIHSQAEIEEDYSEGPYFAVTPNGTAVQSTREWTRLLHLGHAIHAQNSAKSTQMAQTWVLTRSPEFTALAGEQGLPTCHRTNQK